MATKSRPPHTRPASRSPTRFARWAIDYDGSQLQRVLYKPVHLQVLRQARRHQPDPSLILDIGCGTGHLTVALSDSHPGASTIGVDPCAEMIGQAVTAHQGLTWLRAGAEALPFPNGQFDLVVSTMSLRHWRDPQRGLTEVSRVTATGGTLLIADAVLGDVLIPRARIISSGRFGTPRSVRARAWRLGRPRQPARLAAELHHVLRDSGLRLHRVEPIPLPASLTTVALIAADKRR